MQGFSGGCNEGVFFLTVPSPGQATVYALKLVVATRKFPTLPTEAENLTRLVRAFPHIRDDPYVAFPVKIFDCVAPSGKKAYNLLVMKKAEGTRMSEWIAFKLANQRGNEIFAGCETLGRELRIFMNKYNQSQHTDFQPSNIFVHENNGRGGRMFSFIDIGGMGSPVLESDKEHFLKSLEILGKSYGAQFVAGASAAFQKGYAAA
jgi:predicted unusual protein kinase regulating ubiquinone biosynthesis (AarF/ABC1/UbiB family)